MDAYKEKLKLSIPLYALAAECLAKVKPLVTDELAQTYKETLESAKTEKDDAKDLLLKFPFKAYAALCRMDSAFTQIRDLLLSIDLTQKNFTSDFSQTYVYEAHLTQTKYSKEYKKYFTLGVTLNRTIVSNLAQVLFNSMPLEEIRKRFHSWPESIELYIELMKMHMNGPPATKASEKKVYKKKATQEATQEEAPQEATQEGAPQEATQQEATQEAPQEEDKALFEYRQMIKKILEEDKNFVLHDPDEALLDEEEPNSPRVRTFGAIPGSPILDLPSLLEELKKRDPQQFVLKGQTLESFAKKANMKIVVLHKQILYPLTYDLYSLLKKPVEILPGGINQTSLSLNVIQKVEYNKKQPVKGSPKASTKKRKPTKEPKEAKQDYDFSTEVINPKGSKLVVLDSVYRGGYRILETPVDPIEMPQSRPTDYNAAAIEMAKDNMLTYTKVDLKSLEKAVSTGQESKFLRNTLFNELLANFVELENKENPKKPSDYAKLLHNESIVQLFGDIIRKNCFQQVEDKDNKEELLLTFTAHLFNLTIDFKKTLHEQYTFHTKANKSLQIGEKWSTKMEEVLNKTLKKLITDDSDVFRQVVMKEALLNLADIETKGLLVTKGI